MLRDNNMGAAWHQTVPTRPTPRSAPAATLPAASAGSPSRKGVDPGPVSTGMLVPERRRHQETPPRLRCAAGAADARNGHGTRD